MKGLYNISYPSGLPVGLSIVQTVGSAKFSTIKIFLDKEEIGTINVYLTDGQIQPTTLNIKQGYRSQGWGRLLITVLCFYARQCNISMYLLPTNIRAIAFYEHLSDLGIIHLNDPEVQKKVNFGIRRNPPFGNVLTDEEYSENPLKKINEQDFVWIPKGLKIKPTIYIEMRDKWRRMT
jgi:ribosomal protein S18 acetylase RimI-like enzyme